MMIKPPEFGDPQQVLFPEALHPDDVVEAVRVTGPGGKVVEVERFTIVALGEWLTVHLEREAHEGHMVVRKQGPGAYTYLSYFSYVDVGLRPYVWGGPEGEGHYHPHNYLRLVQMAPQEPPAS